MLRAATRGSKLALWQTNHIARLLGVEVEPVIVQTVGDRTQKTNTPIESIRAQSVFVKEVQAAVLRGEADFAVHSAKDMPSTVVDGLTLAAIPERGDPRDAMVGCSLEDLPVGAVIGTSSVRRRAQLASIRSDVTFVNLRGNVDTRLQKAKHFDAIVLAVAPFARLGIDVPDAYPMSVGRFVPQVGQGALAVECKTDNESLVELLSGIEDAPSRRTVDAERSFLARLGGSCDLPVGAYATIVDSAVHVRALLASHDGRVVLRAQDTSHDGIELGMMLADRLLDGAGGRQFLDDYRIPTDR